jgi:hypothetical protein
MKKVFIMALILLLTLSGCKEIDDVPIPIDVSNAIELLEDPTFSTGFNLLGISPVEDGRTIQKWLDYGGEATPAERNVWYMAQWWSTYDVVDASFRKENDTYIYETESRTLKMNPSDGGYLSIDLSSYKEYGDTPRTQGQPWTHALIEQTFNESVGMADINNLIVTLDINIKYVNNMHEEGTYDPGLHAAQFLWYLTLNNVIDEDSNVDEVGTPGDYLWFGIPIYDSRSDFLDVSHHIDQGAAGTTNKLIYSMSSRNYFDEKIEFGKTYHIEIDVLPYLKEAFIYAINNNALVNAQFENMQIGYMNLGWELPGSFEVGSTIQNISIKAIRK